MWKARKLFKLLFSNWCLQLKVIFSDYVKKNHKNHETALEYTEHCFSSDEISSLFSWQFQHIANLQFHAFENKHGILGKLFSEGYYNLVIVKFKFSASEIRLQFYLYSMKFYDDRKAFERVLLL